MAKATSVSVEKLTATVAAAVKAALEKHPRVKVEPRSPLALSYLIWGIPVPDEVAGVLSIKESQAFADDVAAQLGAGLPGHEPVGAVLSRGGHLIIGIPVPPEVLINR